MFIDWIGFVMFMFIIIASGFILGRSIRRKERVGIVLAIMSMLVVIILCPIKYEKDILVEYQFSAFNTHGVIEYVSPFTGEKESTKIIKLSLYNELRKHNHMRMKRSYTLVFSIGEEFIVDE